MDIQQGINQAYCIVEKIPLSAGEYTIGFGLAIPNKEFLFQIDDLTKLIIQPKDVYHSGLAPVRSRSMLAVKHHWIINEENYREN